MSGARWEEPSAGEPREIGLVNQTLGCLRCNGTDLLFVHQDRLAVLNDDITSDDGHVHV